jgi:hypothetical protein
LARGYRLPNGTEQREHSFHQPVHLHVRVHEGVHALYATPLVLSLCTDTVLERLAGRYLLLLSVNGARRISETQVSLAHWLHQQGLQAHSIAPFFALIPAQQMPQLANLSLNHLTLTDTSLSPDELSQLNLLHLLVDTFASSSWQVLFDERLNNFLYCETRDNRFTQLLCRERAFLTHVMARFLGAYLRFHEPDVVPEPLFSPLTEEQLWQYALQGLSPLGVERTEHGRQVRIALGTPDRSVCILAHSCPHMSQIQRSFILRWGDNGWEICSTEETGPPPK